jgi:hypothetical protein
VGQATGEIFPAKMRDWTFARPGPMIIFMILTKIFLLKVLLSFGLGLVILALL